MEENLLLIKTIQKYPCLYNHQSTEYLKKESTEEAWNEVARETKLTVSECKEKWRSLRYGFVRSLRPNADGSAKKKYYLHEDMSFVLPFLKFLNKPTTSYVYLQSGSGDTDEELIENSTEMCQSPQEMKHLELNGEPSRKRKKTATESYGNGKLNPMLLYKSVINEKTEDTRIMFLLSLIPEIMELTENQMKVFRRKVLTLIDDITDMPNPYDNVLNVLQKDDNDFQIEIKSEPD